MSGVSLKLSWAIFRGGLRLIYEYFGTVIITSFLWFAIGLAPLIVITLTKTATIPAVFVIAIVATLFTLGPATAAAYDTIARVINREIFSLGDFFRGFRKYFGRATGLMTIIAVVWAILILDVYFYLYVFQGPAIITMAVLILTFYIVVFWLLMSNWLFPVLVQRPRKIKMILKQAALLALDNLVVSLMITLMVLLVFLVSLLLQVGLILLLIGSIAIFQNFGFLKVLEKYQKKEEAEAENSGQ
ncbi:MAG: DUF624 domain-containing protein [Limnochordia bacterium]|jgi:uncharacterized membrane protein YesL|nr:DUF624 domain-containing protein [Limnochordia bacterium]MDD2628774.1 DUF624 domain-containing protein [Limnochordia bacterium]MDD4517745.1 DUF624 domain-containing protein [Limnochordia bacterium]